MVAMSFLRSDHAGLVNNFDYVNRPLCPTCGKPITDESVAVAAMQGGGRLICHARCVPMSDPSCRATRLTGAA